MDETSFESAFEILNAEAIRRKYSAVNHKDRDLYSIIEKNFQKGPKITIISGLRGVGKTTMLVHLFSKTENGFFFSLDHPLFENINLYDFIKYLSDKKGLKLFFIDEVHYYIEWEKEIKALHDWNQQLCFVISGSSALGLYSLDRRALNYYLPPLAFAEFLRYVGVQIENQVNWMDHHNSTEFVVKNNLEKYFEDYLSGGGFLNWFNMSKEDFVSVCYASIRKSIREDAVNYAKMSKEKIYDLEKILAFLALSPPGELSYTSLSSSFGIAKGTVLELLDILQTMGFIRIITPYPTGAIIVRQQPKMLFSNPILRFVVSKSINCPINRGAIREEFALFHLLNGKCKAYTIKGEKKSPDYVIEKDGKKYFIEIGGESKKRTQLPKDGILVKEHNLIALGLI